MAGARHSHGERAFRIQGAGIVATALRFLPTMRPEYGFSPGKRDVAARERERQLTPTIG